MDIIIREESGAETKLAETNSKDIIIAYQTEEGMGYVKPEYKISFGDGTILAQDQLHIIRDLKALYSDRLSHIIPENIMIELNTTWELTEKTTPNSREGIDISRCTTSERRLSGYQYKIKVKRWWLEHWNLSQTHAAYLSQLLRINPDDGSIYKYNEFFGSLCIATFGYGYLNEDVDIPDCLSTKVSLHNFKRADDQVTMDEKLAGE